MPKMFNTFITLTLLAASQVVSANCHSWLDFEIKKLHSKSTLDLCEITANKPVLIVNTASHCGFTSQFKGLQALHERFGSQGLQIVGFPSNSFRQAASSEEKAASICYVNYGVTFPMTQTVSVTGQDAHPIFKHLSDVAGSPNWNFNKFLISSDGTNVLRFGSSTSPEDSELVEAIKSAL
jgi:glutathione peroxidase